MDKLVSARDLCERRLVNRLARYLRDVKDGPGTMSVRYSRKLAQGLVERITLLDLDELRELFP